MQKNIVQPTLCAPLQDAIDGSGSAYKKPFGFLVPAVDDELLHCVLPLQMLHHRFD